MIKASNVSAQAIAGRILRVRKVGRIAHGTWAPCALPPSQALRVPTPLFKKLDESVVEEEYARMEG
jgi:hypothetical protein